MIERAPRQQTDQAEAPAVRQADDAVRAAALEFVRSLARAAARDLFARQAGGADDAKA